jgi:hypothetical protein
MVSKPIPQCQIDVIVITTARKAAHTENGFDPAKLDHPMNEFGILNNRKRAIIALIHSVVFLGIAFHGFRAPKAGILGPSLAAAGDVVLLVIYLTVASILLWLVTLSRCTGERLYFVLCAGSASFGLLRTVFGDASLPAAQYLRVILLSSAVLVGTWIFRSFAGVVVEEEVASD